jgi:hypothetical protein
MKEGDRTGACMGAGVEAVRMLPPHPLQGPTSPRFPGPAPSYRFMAVSPTCRLRYPRVKTW